MSTYKSIISDIELIQGDSSPIWFIGHPDNRVLNNGEWNGRLIISPDLGEAPIIIRDIVFNSGDGEGDVYEAGTRFVFQILPDESEQLTANLKYHVTIEIWNDVLNFNSEVARFKVKILPGAYDPDNPPPVEP